MESVEMKPFRKTYHRLDMRYQIPRERAFLCALHPYHGFPKVIASSDEWLDLTWCGEPLSDVYHEGIVTMDVARMQFEALVKVVNNNGIKHRDLGAHNLLWHPAGGAHLVDFGISIWVDKEPDVVPSYLWMGAWGICEMTDLDRLHASLWEIETGNTYTAEMWKERHELV